MARLGILERKPLGDFTALNELSAPILAEMPGDGFIRVATEKPLNLKFTVSEVPAGQTSLLLFSPEGTMLAAKRLTTTPLSAR